MPPDYRNNLLHRYVRSFDPRLDEDCMSTTCGEDHGRVCERIGNVEKRLDDHEVRLRVRESEKGATVERFVWVFVTAVICGGVSIVVSLLAAAGG